MTTLYLLHNGERNDAIEVIFQYGCTACARMSYCIIPIHIHRHMWDGNVYTYIVTVSVWLYSVVTRAVVVYSWYTI